MTKTRPRPQGPLYEHTRVIPTFFADTGFDGEVTHGSDPSFGRIIGFTYQKAFGAASGRWSLDFWRGDADPLRLWRDPEDTWVRLDVTLGDRRHPLTLGLVDNVARKISRNAKGERSIGYSLTGRDVGKVLESTELYINIYEQTGALPIIPLYTAVQDDLIGSPSLIVRAILDSWVGNNGVADRQWALPSGLGGGGQSFFDLLSLRFGDTRGKLFEPGLYNPDQFMGRKLWDTLQEYQNGLLNELWLDYAPERPATKNPDEPPPVEDFAPTLFLRERPFPTFEGGRRNWDAVTTWTIDGQDIRSIDVTLGNPTERFNFWMIEGQGLGGERYETIAYIQEVAARERGIPGRSVPIYNLESIRKHGFRKWQMPTRFLPFAEETEWMLQSAPWLQIVHDWYVTSPEQFSGTLSTTRMMPWVRIGDRVRVIERDTDEVIVFYVESVSHNYRYPNAGVSTFTLTRGEREGEDALSLYYATAVTAQTEEADRARIESERLMSVEEVTDRALAAFDASRAAPADVPAESLDASEVANTEGPAPDDTAAAIDAETLGDTETASTLLGREVPAETEALTDPSAEETVSEIDADTFGERRLERGDPIPTEEAPTDDVSAPLEDRPHADVTDTTPRRGRGRGRRAR